MDSRPSEIGRTHLKKKSLSNSNEFNSAPDSVLHPASSLNLSEPQSPHLGSGGAQPSAWSEDSED